MDLDYSGVVSDMKQKVNKRKRRLKHFFFGGIVLIYELQKR